MQKKKNVSICVKVLHISGLCHIAVLLHISMSLPENVRRGGEMENPRRLWVMDRVGAEVVECPTEYGLRSDAQVAVLEDCRMEKVDAFLEEAKKDFESSEAIVFFMIGMDDLAEDAPPVVSETVEGWFHPNGPRQVVRDTDTVVTARYESLVEDTGEKFPSSNVFSSGPAPRRSGGGHAIVRAKNVEKRVKPKSPRHHHFGLLSKFHGSHLGKDFEDPGGRRPILEKYFEADGVHLKKTALTGAIVRARLFVDAMLGKNDVVVTADSIPDLKKYF